MDANENFDTWPRAELVGGPMDGIKILAPEPEYREPLAFPDAENSDSNWRMHWYVPMTVKNLLRKLSIFYYAYAGETYSDEPTPDHGTLYQRSTLAHPKFEDTEEL